MEKINDKFKQIIKNTILNLKFLISNKSTFFIFIFFSFVPVLLTMVLIPISFMGPFIFDFACAIPMLVSYGAITYNFKHSTLYKNLKSTKNSSSTFYISSYLTLNIVSLILFSFVMIELIILDQTNFIIISWLKQANDPNQINIFRLNFFDTFYTLFLYGLVCFSIAYFLSSFIDKQKSYFIIVLIILLLMIIFGGVLNSYFYSNGQYSNETAYVYWLDKGNLFPESIFFQTSILFPFYNIGQISYILTNQITCTLIPSWNSSVEIYFKAFSHIGSNPTDLFRWGFVMFMPYVHILLFASIGSVINIERKR